MAETFGKTWWGQQWLNALKNIDYSNRLARGSSYARKGSVTEIRIQENQIRGKVAGSRPKPYQVDIILPPFFDPELGSLIDALAERPAVISGLLNRELKPEVLDIAEQKGLNIFPKQWTDFKMNCSCPDWAVPCKHLAAVIYKVSAEIDNDPFIVFGLHRVDLIGELKKRGVVISRETTAIPELADLCFLKTTPKSGKRQENPLTAYPKLAYSSLNHLHGPLAALLSESPVFHTGSGNFKESYVAGLERVVKTAQKILKGKISLESVICPDGTGKNSVDPHDEIRLLINEKFRPQAGIDEKKLPLPVLLALLGRIPASQILNYQNSAILLHTALHLCLHLLANGAVVPQIVRYPEQLYGIRWLPAQLSKEVRELVAVFRELLQTDLLIYEENRKRKPVNRDAAENLLSVLLTELLGWLGNGSREDIFYDLFFDGARYAFKKPGEEALCGGIQNWLQKYYLTAGNFLPQLSVEEMPKDEFLLTVKIVETKNTLSAPVSLYAVLTEKKYDQQRFEILQSLTQLSSFIPGLDDFINSLGKRRILLSNETFTPFLLQMIPAIRLLDIAISLPKSLQDILRPKASLKLKRRPGKAFLRIDELLDFDWQVAVGDTLMSEADFNSMLGHSEGLIKHKSSYIYVSSEDIVALHKHFTGEKKLSPLHLLRTMLSGEYRGAKVSLTDEVRQLIEELNRVAEIALPAKINATLRPYQQRGYSWMYRNARLGFGSVIADDMGLGKTLQVITTLMKYKEEGRLKDKKALIVAPTGLLTNWQAEIEKFAPSLCARVYHGTGRVIAKDFDLMLTSYGIVRSDVHKLKKMPWHVLVIDEAQQIKNQDAGQTKAVKSIPADQFIAMSGTPVENRLSELWSIMDYSNRGFFGSLKEFSESYAYPIEMDNDADAAERLKQVTAPFIMRRLKSERSIISDLPDKIEMDCFATLVSEQAALYEKTLEEAMREIERINVLDRKGLFVRQGLVLQMILALKQICNHPTQFLKNNRLDASLSGKLSLLFDKLDSILESNEKVIIFSQFTEMGNLLQQFIKDRYRETPLFYHGGCTLKQRKQMVEAFQHNRADRIFLLSLKAAGTGLNLTAANHVIHFDLWWNPAVEAQATDRAYRIGQKSNVMVHRFITKNTFEERINDMIQSKKKLADMTVATGENWIGNLSNRELNQLFARQ